MYKALHESETFQFVAYRITGDYAVGNCYGVELPHISEVCSSQNKQKAIDRLQVFIKEAGQCLEALEAID